MGTIAEVYRDIERSLRDQARYWEPWDCSCIRFRKGANGMYIHCIQSREENALQWRCALFLFLLLLFLRLGRGQLELYFDTISNSTPR